MPSIPWIQTLRYDVGCGYARGRERVDGRYPNQDRTHTFSGPSTQLTDCILDLVTFHRAKSLPLHLYKLPQLAFAAMCVYEHFLLRLGFNSYRAIAG